MKQQRKEVAEEEHGAAHRGKGPKVKRPTVEFPVNEFMNQHGRM